MNINIGYQFLKLENVTEGVITNISDTYDVVELAIIDEGTEAENLKEGIPENIYLERLDRCLFNATTGKTVYVRMNTGYKGIINYLHADVDGSNLGLSDVYKKAEVDRALGLKADTVYVDGKVKLINTALDTKATTESLEALDIKTTESLDNKVDKSGGKQLSDENFTTVLKTKLEGLPEASQITKSLTGKVDNTVYSQKITDLERRIQALEATQAP